MHGLDRIWWKTLLGDFRSGELVRKVYCRKRENYAVVRASNGIVHVTESMLCDKIHKQPGPLTTPYTVYTTTGEPEHDATGIRTTHAVGHRTGLQLGNRDRWQ